MNLTLVDTQAREGQVGGPLRDRAADEPGAVGTEAADRGDGQVARGGKTSDNAQLWTLLSRNLFPTGQLGRHPQDGLGRRLLRLHAADLPPVLRRLHPPRRQMRHPRMGRQE